MRQLTLLVIACGLPMLANDGAASTAAGGIQLIREPRISMEKERLTIGLSRVTVEYEFLNTSKQDVTTEIAFPLAPKSAENEYFNDGTHPVTGFHLWVDGLEKPYQTEARAFFNGKDVTERLKVLKIDIESIGHFSLSPNREESVPDVERLPESTKAQLRKEGLLDKDPDLPLWEVRITYHWKQTFPAGKVVRVRHEYEPIPGNTNALYDEVKACVDPSLWTRLRRLADTGYDVFPQWVDYILTTANTWKTPIKDFELLIEKPRDTADVQWFVSLCWEGKVQKTSTTFSTKMKNFVPQRELQVRFFRVGKQAR